MLLAAILATIAAPAMAADACLTLKDARAKFPNVHLRYFIEGRKHGGRTCWFGNAPAPRVIRARLPMPRPYTEMTPQQRIDATYSSFIMVDIDPPGWFTIRARQVEGF